MALEERGASVAPVNDSESAYTKPFGETVSRITSRATGEGRAGERPAPTAVDGRGEHQSLRAAIRPAVLLPGGDEVHRVKGIRDEVRLDRRVGVERAGLGRHTIAARGESRGLREANLLHRGEGGWLGSRRGGAAAAAAGCHQRHEGNDRQAAPCIHAIRSRLPCAKPNTRSGSRRRAPRYVTSITRASARRAHTSVFSAWLSTRIPPSGGYEDRRRVLEALLQRLDHGCRVVPID